MSPSKSLSKRTTLTESEPENGLAWKIPSKTDLDEQTIGFELVDKSSHLGITPNQLEMDDTNFDDDDCESLHSIHTPLSSHSSIEEKWDIIIDKNVNTSSESQMEYEEENVSSLISKWKSTGKASPIGRSQSRILACNSLTASIDTEITRTTGELMLCRVNGQQVKMRKNKVFQPLGNETRSSARCHSQEDIPNHSSEQQRPLGSPINENCVGPDLPSHESLHEKSCIPIESELNPRHRRKSESSYYPPLRASSLVQNGNISRSWPKENDELRENADASESYQPFGRNILVSSDHDPLLPGDGTGKEITEAQSPQISDQSNLNFDLEHCDVSSDSVNTSNRHQWSRLSEKFNSLRIGHSLSIKVTNVNISQQKPPSSNDEPKKEIHDKHEDTTNSDYDPPVSPTNLHNDILVSDSRFSDSEHKCMTQELSGDDTEEEISSKSSSTISKEIQNEPKDVPLQSNRLSEVSDHGEPLEGVSAEEEQEIDQGKNSTVDLLPHSVRSSKLASLQEHITGAIGISDEVNSSQRKLFFSESQSTPNSSSATITNSEGIDILTVEENIQSTERKTPCRKLEFWNNAKGESSEAGCSNTLSIVERLTTSETGHFPTSLEKYPTFNMKNVGHTSGLPVDLVRDGYYSATENKEFASSTGIKKLSLPFDSNVPTHNPVDRTSLSAEKLSSILSYLEQVEANSLQETSNLFPHNSSIKGCQVPSGNCSPRAVLEREDSVSVSGSSFSLSSTTQNMLPNGSNLSSSEKEWRLMNCSPNIAASVFQGIRTKMQELKDRIASQEACIVKLEAEKEHLKIDKERELSSVAEWNANCLSFHERERFVIELKNQSAEYKAAIQHHLSLNERMLKDKEELSVKCSTLASNLALAESKISYFARRISDHWLQIFRAIQADFITLDAHALEPGCTSMNLDFQNQMHVPTNLGNVHPLMSYDKH
eukprot:Gb_28638 [translate_table: standard]